MYPLDDLLQPLRPLAEAAFDAEVAVVLTNARRIVVWCNQRFSDLTGIAADEAVGVLLDELRIPEFAPPGAERVARKSVLYPDPFGGRIELESLGVPMYDDGLCVGYAFFETGGASTEELNRLRTGLQSTESLLRESQSLYRELFANSADLIQSTDLAGRVLFVNDAWLRRLGYRESDVAQIRIEEVVAPNHENVLAIFRCEEEGSQHDVRIEMLTSDGARIWAEGSVSYRFVGGRAVGTHAILRDVTEASRLQKLEAEFIAMVNHELRTPLTSIGGSIELLLDGAAGPLPSKAVSFLQIAQRNVERLHSIVGDMLEMERLSVESIELSVEQILASQICRDAVEAHRGFATREGVELSWDADEVLVRTDEHRVHQLLANLISNAVHHASPSRVHISVRRGNGICRIAVADDGVGVPLGFRPFLFERFRQGAANPEGSGLGLSIVAALAERLGAEIGWCSVEGTGSVFWVELVVPSAAARGANVEQTSDTLALLWSLGTQPDASLVLSDADESLLTQLVTAKWSAPLRVFGATPSMREHFDGEFDFQNER